MYSAYGEFLSLANIDAAVDGLYKAYLDSVLIDYRTRQPSSFWDKVEAFRKANLDPFTLASGRTKLSDAERASAESQLSANRERLQRAKDYLYWFDVRAKFWSEVVLDEQITDVVASAKDLLNLQVAAKGLQTRRERALHANCSGLPLLDSLVASLERLIAKRKEPRAASQVEQSGGGEGKDGGAESTG